MCIYRNDIKQQAQHLVYMHKQITKLTSMWRKRKILKLTEKKLAKHMMTIDDLAEYVDMVVMPNNIKGYFTMAIKKMALGL